MGNGSRIELWFSRLFLEAIALIRCLAARMPMLCQRRSVLVENGVGGKNGKNGENGVSDG